MADKSGTVTPRSGDPSVGGCWAWASWGFAPGTATSAVFESSF